MKAPDLNADTINFVPSLPKGEKDTSKSFRLTEILLIISAVGIVVFLVLLAINPSKEASEARNLKRSADVSTILSYLTIYVDQKEIIPEQIPISTKCVEYTHEICKTGPYNCTDFVNMGFLTEENQEALVIMPNDPMYISVNGTGYFVSHDDKGVVTVCAPHAERNEQISFSKDMY